MAFEIHDRRPPPLPAAAAYSHMAMAQLAVSDLPELELEYSESFCEAFVRETDGIFYYRSLQLSCLHRVMGC